jgi:hypothetical protein
VVGEDDGLFGANVDEELQRCIHVLLFHIPVFSISFIVCVFVSTCSTSLHLFYCMYILRIFLTYSHVNHILFVATLK